MTGSTHLTHLRNLLAELYPDEASIRRLLADAGIPAGRIALTSSAVNNWHLILTEAEKSHKITALLDVALAEYGDNPRLRAAVTAYQRAAAAAEIDPPLATALPATAPSPSPSDIFLSYSRTDRAEMQRLRAELQAAGFTIWIDDLNLEPGTPSWQRAVEAAIHAARCMVVILSPAAKNSAWVGRELSYAETLGRPIFPVLVSGDATNAIPISLIDHQRVDLRAGWRPVAERLIPALRRQLGAGVTQSILPSTSLHNKSRRSSQWGMGISIILIFVTGLAYSVLQFGANDSPSILPGSIPIPTARAFNIPTPTATALPKPTMTATVAAVIKKSVPTATTIPLPTATVRTKFSMSTQISSVIITSIKPVAEILKQDLNVRQGPGTNYRVLIIVSVGDKLNVTGRNSECSWLQITYVRIGPNFKSQIFSGWITSAPQYVRLKNAAQQEFRGLTRKSGHDPPNQAKGVGRGSRLCECHNNDV